MSNRSHNGAAAVPRRVIAVTLAWILAGALLAAAAGSSAPAALAETTGGPSDALPRLVRAREGDTAATLARRYLGDGADAWIIAAYNGTATFEEGQAVMIPTAPFRLGGLTPDGFQNVPVLGYAEIEAGNGKDMTVSAAAFQSQMQWLQREGYTAISPSQLARFLYFTGQLPPRAVLITADTQSTAFLRWAVPILKQAGFTATLFVASDAVGGDGAMGWDDLRRLANDGFTIGCRGGSGRALVHRHERGAPRDRFTAMHAELHKAKATLESRLGIPCTVLAYPTGESDRLLAATAARLGFDTAFTRSAGENPFFVDRLAIHRIMIDGRMTTDQFARRVVTQIKADLH